jgi:hypothetical protein
MIQSHDLFGFELSQSDTHSAHDIIHDSGGSLLQALHESQNLLQALHQSQTLGQEYLINDSGQVAPVVGHSSSSGHTTGPITQTAATPPPTVVAGTGGFKINLIWDSSVNSAPDPSGFMQAVKDAAQYYASQFSNTEIVNINVGYGEIAGGQLSAGALGESESYGYLTNYTTITNALAAKDNFHFTFARNEPNHSQFFVTSAEAKTLGLVNASGTALDGYIGFGDLSSTGGYSWNLTATTAGQNMQFDLQSVALHEISEVLGRIGMEGALVNNHPTYTPLDLFNFAKPNVLALSPSSGYFSTDNGHTNLGWFNNSAANGGDIADWASNQWPWQAGTVPNGSMDAFDAFSYPGYNGDISTSDLNVMAALGYTLKVQA